MKLNSLKLFPIIIFASIPTLFVSNEVKALPAGVPGQPCGTLSNPSPGALCYAITPGGGKAGAGDGTREFQTIIQSTEREYVIADVVIEVLDATGTRSNPTKHTLSPGGTASVVSVAINKLRELKQIKTELQAKAKVLTGSALVEGQAKLNSLSEEERIYENVVTTTTAAGQDAGKIQVTSSASSRRCGLGGFDKCGSWIHYNIYEIRRYVGNPIAAYNRAFLVAKDAETTIDKLVAEQQSIPTANPPVEKPPASSSQGDLDQPTTLECPKIKGIYQRQQDKLVIDIQQSNCTITADIPPSGNSFNHIIQGRWSSKINGFEILMIRTNIVDNCTTRLTGKIYKRNNNIRLRLNSSDAKCELPVGYKEDFEWEELS